MPMYNLKEYSDDHSKTSGRLRQQYRDEPALIAIGTIDDLPGNTVLLSKQKINRSNRS